MTVTQELIEELRRNIYNKETDQPQHIRSILRAFTQKVDGFKDRERRMIFPILYWLNDALENGYDFQIALTKIPISVNRDELFSWFSMDVRNFYGMQAALKAKIGMDDGSGFTFLRWIMAYTYSVMGNHLLDAIAETQKVSQIK